MNIGPRKHLLLVAALALLAGCDTPPPSAYVADDALVSLNPGAAAADDSSVAVADNQVKEACRYQPGRLDDVDVGAARAVTIRCGTWTQPSGRVFQLTGGASDPARLQALATGGAWKTYLDQRLLCQAPAPTKILGDVPAVLLQCTRRNGGWPHLALAASLDGKTFVADGVLPAFPALESTLGALGNRPVVNSGQQRSAAYEILAARFASQPFGSGDLDRYFGLMKLGDQYNEVENYAGAEDSFRDALAVQQRILGSSDPSSARPMMKLAAQISNQGRFVEADGLLDRAGTLAARTDDGLLNAELAYYRAAHAANQRKREDALELATIAKRDYEALIPDHLRDAAAHPKEKSAGSGNGFGFGGAADDLFVNPQQKGAVLGLAETLRLQSVLYNRLGKLAESQATANEAKQLLDNSGMNPPGVIPRTIRIAALSQADAGNLGDASKAFETSEKLFQQDSPNERPLAITYLLSGGAEYQQGKAAQALVHFRAGAQILRDRRLGAPEALIAPYLDALYAASTKDPGAREALHREMFEAAQLAQGGLTAQFIAKAAARLATGDQAASALLRHMQEIDLQLRNLFALRDAEAQHVADQKNAPQLQRIDEQITQAENERNEAESAVQAAAPAYRQLIQTGASAAKVAGLLRPNEAFLSLFIGDKHGYGFLLKGPKIEAYPIDQSMAAITEMVGKIRQSSIVNYDAKGNPELKPYDLATAYALYSALFKPIEPALGGTDEIVVSANGPLLSLPFAALVTESVAAVSDEDYRKVPWLLRRYALSYVPVPQTFIALRQIKAASAASKPFIGFGDFRPASPAQLAAAFPADRCASDNQLLGGLSELPGTRQEVTRIAARLGAGSDSVILGADLTKDKLNALDLGKYKIVHFATHAFLPTEIHCLSEPTILLSVAPSAASAAEGFLQPDEILKMHLDADLVVLSACNTAGPDGHSAGESLSGLARTFFFAGTRGLLATHWSVNDTAAMLVMTETLAGNGAVQDTVTSLRHSQLSLLDSAGAPGGLPIVFSHPFAWAPFVLIGDGVKPPAGV